jgi:hypothetical protein
MLHARSDYQRIQDPAANKDLVLAYNAAMNLVARGPLYGKGRPVHSSETEAYSALSELCRHLTPTLGLIVDAKGVYMPAHPIADDEPVFVLRASDMHAPETVEKWAALAYDRGKGDDPFSRSAMAHADRMREWAGSHGGSKRPDAPPETLEWWNPPTIQSDATTRAAVRAAADHAAEQMSAHSDESPGHYDEHHGNRSEGTGLPIHDE